MTLVLVHSAGATPAVWDAVRQHLVGIPVLTPALPGRPGGGELCTDVSGYTDAVVRQMDDAGVTRAALAGHSFGGGVVLWLALTRPDRVGALGLLSTGARLRVQPDILAALPDRFAEVVPFMAASHFPAGAPAELTDARQREYERVGAETVRADLNACDRFDVLDRLWEIRARTQILVGSDDILTPPKYARALAERISAARLVEYPGAGHMLPIERAGEVAGELAVLWAASLDGPSR